MRVQSAIFSLLLAALLATRGLASGAKDESPFTLSELGPVIVGKDISFYTRAVLSPEGLLCPGAAYRLWAPGYYLTGKTLYEAGKEGPAWGMPDASPRRVPTSAASVKLRTSLILNKGAIEVGGSENSLYLIDLEGAGSTHVFVGKCENFVGYVFDGDAEYPLTFKKVQDRGYVHLCGRGTIATTAGQLQRLGYGESATDWVPRLRSGDQLRREGAAQALGYLATTKENADRAVPALIAAVADGAKEVRRNAAEALGRIGDPRAIEALARLTEPADEKDDWVRDVAEESLGLIGMKTAAPKLPDEAALASLTEGLKHKWPLVRATAAELLALGGSEAVDPLIAALKDPTNAVRVNAARSLCAIGDARAVTALREAVADEKDETNRKAMQEALERLGE